MLFYINLDKTDIHAFVMVVFARGCDLKNQLKEVAIGAVTTSPADSYCP